jgi:hypothetical protein
MYYCIDIYKSVCTRILNSDKCLPAKLLLITVNNTKIQHFIVQFQNIYNKYTKQFLFLVLILKATSKFK